MRAPSLRLARMAPPWTATRAGSWSGGANSSASSPSTKRGFPFRKCAPTTGAPAAIRRARSAIDGVSATAMASRRAFLEALADHALGQFAADEHDAALAFLGGAPVALVVAVEHHVDALGRGPLRIVLERQDALGAQDLLAFLGDQVLDPGKEFVRIERLVGAQRQRLHVLVVVVLQAAVIMMVMMVALAVIVVMIVILAALQELRLDIENP